MSVLLAAEMEQFDNDQSKAIDGDGGGAYSPTSPIAIGGHGIQLTGAFNQVTSTGFLTFKGGAGLFGEAGTNAAWDGNWTFQTGVVLFNDGWSSPDECDITSGGLLHIASGANFSAVAGSGVTLSGAVAYNGTAFACSGPVALTGTITCSGGGSHISGTCNVGGTLVAEGTLTVASGCLFTIGAGSNCTLAAPLVANGVGRVIERTITGADANTTFTISDASTIVCSPTAPRTYVLSVTGAVDGDRIRFVSVNANLITITNSIPATIGAVRAFAGANFQNEFLFHGGAWVLASSSPF